MSDYPEYSNEGPWTPPDPFDMKNTPSTGGNARQRRKDRRTKPTGPVIFWEDQPPTLPQLARAAREGRRVVIRPILPMPF